MPVLAFPSKKKKPRAPARPTLPVRRYQPETLPSPHAVPPVLTRKLRALSSRYRFLHAGRWLLRALAAALLLLAVQMLLDWLIDLKLLVRAVLLLADLSLLAYLGRKQLLPLLRLRLRSLESSALMIEKQWPALRGRVIAAVQFGAPGVTRHSPELVETLQRDAGAQTAPLDLGRVVPLGPFLRALLLALVAAAVWTSLLVAFRPGSFALLERVFLLPAHVPRKTDVTCLSGDKVIPVGTSVTLEAQARGIIPSHGRITLEDETGRIQEITLDPEPAHPDRFSLQIASVERPFTYTIRLNDGSSGEFRVKTVPRPDVVSLDCEQVYPAYVGKGTVKRAVENLSLLAGSKLQIHAVANGKITRAVLKLIGLGRDIPLQIGGADGTDLTGAIDIPATGLTAFSIELTNQAGITSGDQTQYPIDVIPDRPPVVQLTAPDQLEELDTIQAQVAVAYTATDDYGLGSVFLCYRLQPKDTDSGGTISDADVPADNSADTTDTSDTTAPTPAAVPAPAVAVQKIPLDLGGQHPLTFKGTYTWDLAALQPPLVEGTVIEYWIEARDLNNVTGPGVTESEHHTLKIVSEIEKKAEIMNRLLDKLTNLKDIQDDENKINTNLHNVIENKPASP